ncbi:S8 family serine peptidase [Neobacillus sp. CF12]|uniref:S8 family serine peptidase n=1 Tax=Neobacillus sp. CF12 TaxID=3055864 RepID=UPI0025A279EA|nr:S8 family serine peptidase [Neobacillus sp. CF12]MDM5331620.1 S8 family serine peptidase [Neobacillus sp. CF12]
MSKRMGQTKRVLSIFVLIAMLLNIALPQSLTLVQAAAGKSQQSKSSETFNAEEVNRILKGLTPEQKANINKLTGAENSQKIHVNQKELRSTENINVIVQFKVDPAKIQIIKQSLAKGGASLNSQAFASEFSEAKKKVEASHANFKSFVKTNQPKPQIIGGKSAKTSMNITREYSEAFNGVSLTLPANMVETVANNPEVASVWPQVEYHAADQGTAAQTSETSGSVGKPTAGLTFMGIDKLQAEGHTGIIKSGPRAGQKVKVGVLDTGIDYNHPDLKKVYKGGHDLVNSTVDANGDVIYIDDNDPMETIYPDWEAAKANPNPMVGPPPADYKKYITSHGSHVSGTIAASTTSNNAMYSANGVAPDVDLYGYRVLGPGGRGTADSVLKGIDQSVKDNMDVINLSLGANINDPLYPNSVAINNATLSGVVCLVAAGNAGPGQATVGSPGTSPLGITVGASSIPEQIPTLTIANGSATYKARLFGKSFANSDNPFAGQTLPIVDVGLGSAADYAGKDLTGKIALVQRGGDLLNVKMTNAKQSGAAGMIIWNNKAEEDNQGYINANLGVSMDWTYAISLTEADGKALSEAVSGKSNATITFPNTLDAPVLKNGDELANFSSTGPVKDWNIKPDVVAPGVNILSTVPYDVWGPQNNATTIDYTYAYQLMSGTSMATPHTAGIAALVFAAHPDYTPADVKTALMNTAKDINTDSKTYSVYQVGAGRVDPARAINADVKIQVLDKVFSRNEAQNIVQIENITGNLFFGFKGRGEGAPSGSDDVIQSKNLKIVNSGTNNKTFNVSKQFITTKFAQSNPVGPGTGNNVKIDISTGSSPVTSIDVSGGSAVNAKATITVPANAIDGTYEGYVNFVNAADPTDSYRIPFTIIIAEKGINFKVNLKAFSPGERYTGNFSPAASIDTSAYSFSVNSGMESIYVVVKDKDGNYIGVVQDVQAIDAAGPGVQYGPIYILTGGKYLPFTKPYNGTLDQSGIDTTPAVLKEGAYTLEIIATDASGAHYTANDTVYVDYTAPTITMDADSKPGIYEIDPTGYLPGQEIKGFYGKVYDNNIDVMKNNGETSVPNWNDPSHPSPVDQALNNVWGYEGPWPTTVFSTNEEGRFHFGISPEDITPEGKDFRVYPVDYATSGDMDTTTQQYYFIKKGSPYVTLTSSGGVESVPNGPVVVPNQAFKGTIATKNGTGMIGGKFTINNSNLYTFSNIRLSQEYSQYLEGKGITPTLTVSQPYNDSSEGGQSTDITISGIGAAGALDHDMNIIEADVTYTSPNPFVGAAGYFVTKSSFTYSDAEKKVANFEVNYPNVKMPTSMLTGGLLAESFMQTTLGGSFTNIIRETGGKVTVRDSNNNVVAETDKPSTDQNSIQYQGNSGGTYGVIAPVSDNPYNVEVFMPGHFKDYYKSPVIGSTKYGYRSGSYWDRPNYEEPLLLAGDVNGDNVIDMNDLIAEIQAFEDYQFLFGPIGATSDDKVAFFTNPTTGHRNNDISWSFTGQNQFGGFSYSKIDYNDFYYIFKNFGQVNQTAVNAGISVPTPQLTVPSNQTITSNRGSYTSPTFDTAVKTLSLTAGDDLNKVRAALNFSGPAQKTSATQLPTLPDLKNGSSIELIPSSTTILDDIVWRKAITKVELVLGTTTTDVTSAATVSEGYRYFDPLKGPTNVPSKIKLPGSLFTATGAYSVKFYATGYTTVTVPFSIADVPIPTPNIPLVTDPSKAHIGKDLTFTFTDDANWRNGINKIVVTTGGNKSVDITSLRDDNNNLYYDITNPGQITFKPDLFKTNTTLTNSTSYQNATLDPGGANYLPQTYKFVIDSTFNGTVYPQKTIGGDSTFVAAQAVGYSVTFDSGNGGSLINPIAVGYQPSRTREGTGFPIAGTRPAPTRNGYSFVEWRLVDPVTHQVATSQWNPNTVLTTDITVSANWKMNYTQNLSPVDKTKPDGAKFAGLVLGEDNLNINIPDYATNVSWLTGKEKIAKIEKTYKKLDSSGLTIPTTLTETIDPSTYGFTSNTDGSGTLSLTTATEKYANAHPTEKFAFSEAPSSLGYYTLTITSTTNDVISIPNVKLGYRAHFDLNGGTLKNPTNTVFNDKFVNGRVTSPDMSVASTIIEKLANGVPLAINQTLYLDAANTKGMESDISAITFNVLKDNVNYYVCWTKAAPAVSKDTDGNIVGSDITLKFTDDGTWKNNITKVKIGSKELVRNTDYTITDGAIILNHYLFTAGQKVNVTIISEGYQDVIVTDQVIGHLVTFDSNGGDYVASQIVDSRITKPTVDPTKVGYKFMGWYTDAALTTPFDFANIVTEPTTLYAKYALATSIVSADTKDNVLGNDMTIEFSDVNWAKDITSIKLNGTTVDVTKYKVDPTLGTITLDKSLFTKIGDFTIIISAAEYADVTVSQKVITGYNVHFVLPSDAPTEVKDGVKDQNVARRITEPVVYGYDLAWFADEECTIPWDFTSSIYSAKTIYGKWSLHKFTIVFDRQDGGLVESKTGDYSKTINAPTAPIRSGYAFLGWYKDAEGKTAWNFASDKVSGDTILYAKWAAGVENHGVYNQDVKISFNEATAKLDGKDFTSGTAVTGEGNYTLVITDAAGNVSTVKFTIDKTAPKAPIVNKVTSTAKVVTGKAEVGSTILIKAGTKTLGTGTVDSNGKFTVSIVKQTVGTHLYVTAIDKAGNESSATKETVSK